MSIAGEARPFPTPAQRRRAEANRAIAKAKLKTAALKAERTAKKQQADSVKSQSASSAVQVHAMPGVTHFASPSPSRSRSARGDRKRAAVGDAFGASLGARSSFQMFQRFQHQSFQQFQAMLRAEGILDSNNMALATQACGPSELALSVDLADEISSAGSQVLFWECGCGEVKVSEKWH